MRVEDVSSTWILGTNAPELPVAAPRNPAFGSRDDRSRRLLCGEATIMASAR
jgi:hypothetical protein